MDVKSYKPLKGDISPRFTQISTFARLPMHSGKFEEDCVFIGVPYDGSTSFKTGSRMAPSAIREASRNLREYNYYQKINPYEIIRVSDYGDININPMNAIKTFELIESELGVLLDNGITPMIAGGDHSITLPSLRAISKKYGKVNVVHFDAHFDFWDNYWGERYTHSTWLRRAFEENLVKSAVQLGIRAPLYDKTDMDYLGEMKNKITVFDATEIRKKGVHNILDEIYRILTGDIPTYITFDIDAIDPAFAPGTGAPEISGLYTDEVMDFLRGLKRYNLVGIDVVEVIPSYDDKNNITSLVAANIFYEFMCSRALLIKGGRKNVRG